MVWNRHGEIHAHAGYILPGYRPEGLETSILCISILDTYLRIGHRKASSIVTALEHEVFRRGVKQSGEATCPQGQDEAWTRTASVFPVLGPSSVEGLDVAKFTKFYIIVLL